MADAPLRNGCTRRAWLKAVALAALAPAARAPARSSRVPPPVLGPPDALGLRLPPGFSARIVARSGEEVAGSGYRWHGAPDGGAVFAQPDGGWIYVSNSELPDGRGGVGALRFDRRGRVVDAWPVMTGGRRNCAGGATPWGTWLSCEEVDDGLVWECDPLGREPPRPLPALGRFAHEAAAVDPRTGAVYLTDDSPHGLLYRWIPEGWGAVPRLERRPRSLAELGAMLQAPRYDPGRRPRWDKGRLQVLVAYGGEFHWKTLPRRDGQPEIIRSLPYGVFFDGAEGIAWFAGGVAFATKGDGRILWYQPGFRRLGILWDPAEHQAPGLTHPDNLAVTPGGNLLAAEDGGQLRLSVVTRRGHAFPVVQVTGQPASELAGPAFDPSGTRLYFSSQRGTAGHAGGGITYEVQGPFRW